MIPNMIVLISRGRYDEANAGAVCWPGMLGAEQSDGTVIPHNVVGGGGPFVVVQENALLGGTINTSLPNNNTLPLRRPARGDVLLMLLQAGQNVTAETALMSAGDGTLIANPLVTGSNLYQIVADSTTVTNTASESTFSNGSYTLPANLLAAGDDIVMEGVVEVTAQNSSDTHDVRVYFGTTNLVLNTGAVALSAAQTVSFRTMSTIRTAGASGTFESAGIWSAGAAVSATEKSYDVTSTSINTTAAQVLKVTVQANNASTGNTSKLGQFRISVNKAGGLNTLVYAKEAVDNSGSTGTSGFNTAAFIRVAVP